MLSADYVPGRSCPQMKKARKLSAGRTGYYKMISNLFLSFKVCSRKGRYPVSVIREGPPEDEGPKNERKRSGRDCKRRKRK
jgi:hypothetical protein